VDNYTVEICSGRVDKCAELHRGDMQRVDGSRTELRAMEAVDEKVTEISSHTHIYL
jgi:hypothetical protein